MNTPAVSILVVVNAVGFCFHARRGILVAKETIQNINSANSEYGFIVIREVGFDIKELGTRRVMVVIDRRLADMAPTAVVLDALKRSGIEGVLYGGASIELPAISLR